MSDLMALAGKTAIVTGGATGIGLATARLFGSPGARVAILGHDGPAVDRAIGELEATGVRRWGLVGRRPRLHPPRRHSRTQFLSPKLVKHAAWTWARFFGEAMGGRPAQG